MKEYLSIGRLIRRTLILSVFCGVASCLHAQFYSVQTNVLELATTTFNVEGSMMLSKHWTAHVGVAYNPWTFKGNRKIKQLTLEPGARYWTNQTYIGSFVSLHGIASLYNYTLGDNRTDGKGIGMGASYGRTWLLGTRWNLEVEGGIGFAWGDYVKYKRCNCGDLKKKGYHFLPIPKVAVNLIYLF